jgi:hypothetical protein
MDTRVRRPSTVWGAVRRRVSVAVKRGWSAWVDCFQGGVVFGGLAFGLVGLVSGAVLSLPLTGGIVATTLGVLLGALLGSILGVLVGVLLGVVFGTLSGFLAGGVELGVGLLTKAAPPGEALGPAGGSTELAPAKAPEGRGDETTPAR